MKSTTRRPQSMSRSTDSALPVNARPAAIRRGSILAFKIAIGAVFVGVVAAGCSGNGAASEAPTISGDMAPAPGARPGLRTVADVDYEQIVLSADTQLIKLAELAQEPARGASAAVRRSAKEIDQVAGPDAKVLRMRLVKSGDALTDHHGSESKEAKQLQDLKSLAGSTFDRKWQAAVLRINQEIIDAATVELNRGEDQETRALARTRIESAAKLKSQLSA